MDLVGKEVLARIFHEGTWEEWDGVILLEERKVCKDRIWMESRWIVLQDRTQEEFRLSHRLY